MKKRKTVRIIIKRHYSGVQNIEQVFTEILTRALLKTEKRAA